MKPVTLSGRLNRPFKSPMMTTTSPAARIQDDLTSTPTETNKKRARISQQSPLSLPACNSTPIPQPKRTRLSIKSVASADELRLREAGLDEEIGRLQSEGLSIDELDSQINLLHRYNDIKDVAQIVMGRLAELEGVTVKSLHEKYGAPLCKD